MSTNAAVALLLEDEPLISMDVEQALEGAGFDVATVMSCSEAEVWLADRRPDIAIVDIMLQDGPADEVVQHLIEGGIPFVVHSGESPKQHAGSPFAHACWLSKPADPDELVSAARALLAPNPPQSILASGDRQEAP